VRQFVSKATRLGSRVAFCLSDKASVLSDHRSPVPGIEIASDFYTGREMELFALVPRCIGSSSLKEDAPNDEDRFHRGGSRSGADVRSRPKASMFNSGETVMITVIVGTMTTQSASAPVASPLAHGETAAW